MKLDKTRKFKKLPLKKVIALISLEPDFGECFSELDDEAQSIICDVISFEWMNARSSSKNDRAADAAVAGFLSEFADLGPEALLAKFRKLHEGLRR